MSLPSGGELFRSRANNSPRKPKDNGCCAQEVNTWDYSQSRGAIPAKDLYELPHHLAPPLSPLTGHILRTEDIVSRLTEADLKHPPPESTIHFNLYHEPMTPEDSAHTPASQSSAPSRPSPSAPRPPVPSSFSPSHYYPPHNPSNREVYGLPGHQSFPFQYVKSQPPPTGTMYPQRPPYMPQYSMSPAPQPASHFVQPHTYTYGHSYSPRGQPSPDNNLLTQNMGIPYPSPSTMPSMQHIYPYHQQHSPDSFDAAHSQYGLHTTPPNAPGSFPKSEIDGTASSSRRMNPVPSQSSPSEPPYQAAPSYLNTSTPPYAYSHNSFAHPAHSLYQTPYVGGFSPPYYRASPPDDARGTWWYLPPGIASPTSAYEPPRSPHHAQYPNNFPSHITVNRPDVNQYRRFSPDAASFVPSLPSRRDLRSEPSSQQSRSDLEAQPALMPPHRTVVEEPPAVQMTSTSRKPYHPNPPANRSEWVMWVGNVPPDATHDELWRFFSHSQDLSLVTAGSDQHPTGVSSVFLISRSKCAFVNFESEATLHEAVSRFNGQPLRPKDSRGMKLVCRIRKPDDDLRAGVGGQRGIGMHTRWIREQKQKTGTVDNSTDFAAMDVNTAGHPTSPELQTTQSTSSEFTHSSTGDGKTTEVKHSSSSDSHASTTSSFLTKNYPKRYFILKSLNEADLLLSIQRGIWATQPHNEGILDQAFRTSKDVHLIFSANKSREFFGYARMAGPIKPGGKRFSWATRSDSTLESLAESRAAKHTQSSAGKHETTAPELPTSRKGPPSTLLSPSEHRMASTSPGALTPSEEQRLHTLMSTPQASSDLNGPSPPCPAHTAPAEMEHGHDKLSFDDRVREAGTLDPYHLPGAVTASASMDVKRKVESLPNQDQNTIPKSGDMLGSSTFHSTLLEDSLSHEERLDENTSKPSDLHPSTEKQPEGSPSHKETWGNPFKVDWIETSKLSFQQTRHLRNPWNHGREVKVSRDGTELEPGVGAALIAEWDKQQAAS